MRFLLLLLMLVALPLRAELYVWTDEQGRKHFSDRKPASGKVEVRDLPAARPDEKNAGAGSTSAGVAERQREMLRVLDEERAERNAAKAREDAERRRHEAECAKASDYRKRMEGHRMFETDAKGQRRYLSDAEIDAAARKLDAGLKENCR